MRTHFRSLHRSAGRRRAVLLTFAMLPGVAAVVCLLLWRQSDARADLVRAPPEAILASPRLRDTAIAIGRPVYRAHCADCHGPDGRGATADGVPDLRDRDWLYGEGRVAEIETVVRYGIRSHHSKGWNLASMPAYASAHPYAAEPIPPLAPQETDDVVQLLLNYEGRSAQPAAVTRGRAVYQKAGCWDCHGAEGYGDPAVGAPNLRDAITLYGSSQAALARSVEQGRHGASPAFAGRLEPIQIRAVAVYVATLSAGVAHPPAGNVP
jgi:cytochrome c oxidase cbb3-type subunit 3